MKKALVLLLCLVMSLTTVFAQGASEPKADEPITLEFWTHEDAARQALEDRYIEEFKQLHPNVEVNVTRQSAEKLRELSHTSFSSGEVPSFFNLPSDNEFQ